MGATQSGCCAGPNGRPQGCLCVPAACTGTNKGPGRLLRMACQRRILRKAPARTSVPRVARLRTDYVLIDVGFRRVPATHLPNLTRVRTPDKLHCYLPGG